MLLTLNKKPWQIGNNTQLLAYYLVDRNMYIFHGPRYNMLYTPTSLHARLQ